VSGTVQTGPRRLFGVRALVFEVRASNRGISHRLLVPRESVDFVVPQLRTLVPGSTVTPAGGQEQPDYWTVAVELGQTNSRRTLSASNAEALSAGILATLQGLGTSEALVLQWVVSPALREQPPRPRQDRTGRDSFMVARFLEDTRNADAVADIRSKLAEPNFLSVLRVAARARDEVQANRLLSRVRSSIAGVATPNNQLRRRPISSRPISSRRVVERVTSATVPLLFPARMSASELAALIAWPIGNPHVAGLPRGRTRQLAASGLIPRTGRVLARSNFPGDERLLALSPIESAKHLQIVGPTGSGKTALLTNLMAQDMNAGRGVILIESKGDLFYEALARVPEHRVQDVVLLDVGDTEHPVGFNILQGSPYVVAADIQRLFDHLYPQDARGVRVRQGFYHLILTLMMSIEAVGAMTFADLQPLAVPRPDQAEFSARLIRGVSHIEELAAWWQEITDLPKAQRDLYFRPIMDRIWQLASRRSLRNIIGQSTSTVNLTDIIKGRKILLINLGRATEGKDTAGLLGSLLLNAIWSAVQGGIADPTNPTMLYLDEFQDFLNLPISPGDMLAKSRSLGLAMTVAHQFIGQLSRELQDATQNNARSTVVFQTSADEAKYFARGFGSTVTEDDFMNLRQFEVIARLATGDGVSAPVTGVTLPPVRATGSAGEARRRSRERYGRPVAEVEQEIRTRRGVAAPTSGKATRPKFGGPR
jgi:hypothetical protein